MENRDNSIGWTGTAIGILRLDKDLRVLDMSNAMADIIGTKKTVGNISQLPAAEFFIENIEKADIKGENKQIFNDHNNNYWLVETSKCGKVYSFAIYDLNNYEKNADFYEYEISRYKALISIIDCGLWEYDVKSKTVTHLKKLKGRFNDSDLVIENFREQLINWNCIYPEDIATFHRCCDSMDNGDEHFYYEIRCIGDNDDFIWISYEGTTLRKSDGSIDKVIGKTSNINEKKQRLDTFTYYIEKDFDTDVFNKEAAITRIEQSIEKYGREMHGLYLIDINDSYTIVDEFGKIYMQMILQNLAASLKERFGEIGIVGRFSSDRFVIFVKRVDKEDFIVQFAEDILRIANKDLKEQFNNIPVSLSVGVSVYRYEREFSIISEEYEKLYSQADKALYYVKNTSMKGYEIYTDSKDYSQYSKSVRIQKDIEDNNNQIYTTAYTDKRLTHFVFQVVNEYKNVKDAISIIFSEIGKYYRLDKISLFENNNVLKTLKIKYEWRSKKAERISADYNENMPVDWEMYTNRFSLSDIYSCENVNALKRTPYQSSEGFGALLQCALYNGDKFYGTLNFENLITRRWSHQEKNTLEAISKIISIYLLQINDKERLNDALFFNQAMLDNQKLSNYAIKKSDYELLYISKYAEKEFEKAQIGLPCYKTLYGKDKPCEACPIKGLSEYDKSYAVESYDSVKCAWYSTTVTSISTSGRDDMFLICKSDVTNFMDRLQTYDTLTGIYTPQKFEALANKILAENYTDKYAIISTDIERFKFINNEWGFTVGNEVLKVYAAECSTILEEGEFCARSNGDHFTIMLKYTDKSQLEDRIRTVWNNVISCLKHTYINMNISFVAGVFFADDKTKYVSQALDFANIARKSYKGKTLNTINYYDQQLDDKIKERKEIEQLMKGALKNGEFIVYYQPKVDLKLKKIVAAEALVRWKKPDGTIIYPDKFIPIFEQNGFIDELDFCVYEQVFKRVREWIDNHQKYIVISVNVSRVHILDSMFMDKMGALTKKYGIPTNLIELELTENIVLNNVDRLIFMIKRLHEMGFLISIDDFGSGYSSLNILKQLPIDILKLDKEFFLQNTMDYKNRVVISSILQLAQKLQIKAISEGVETVEQERFLSEEGCDMAQGYLFHKPMPLEDFERLIL